MLQADRPKLDTAEGRQTPPPVPRPENDGLTRFLGGQPGAVALKLVVLSVVVGAVLNLAGLSPVSLLLGVEALVRSVIGNGWETVKSLAEFALYGAMVVIPIWLIGRAFASRR